MNPVQLAFFPFRKPLLDLLGADFFKDVPRAPGVYKFLSERGKVLYVGQSKDLRTRLAYYKNARPDREPRRIVRMIARARALHFEICSCPEEAEARELLLIQEHRPSYNRALNGNPRHPFVVLGCDGGSVVAKVSDDPEVSGADVFGAFRSFGRCRSVLQGIARLTWAAEHPTASAYDIPLQFSESSRMAELVLARNYAPMELLRDFLGGLEDSLSEWFLPLVDSTRDPHLQAILANDLLLLGEFFATGPELNHRISELHRIPLPLPAGELDQLRLRTRRRLKLAPSRTRHESVPSRQ